MKTSESIANLAAALSRVQAKLNGAVKESTNPFFKSKYANLESLWGSIRAPMAEEGLSVSQMPGMLATGQPTLITMLMHKSGEFLSSEQALFPGKQDPQGVAAATTYARRSALSAFIGQVEVDDDGESAMGRGNNPDNTAAPGSYVITVVKEVKGKRLNELPYDTLNKLGKWLSEKAKRSAVEQETLDAIAKYLDHLDSIKKS